MISKQYDEGFNETNFYVYLIFLHTYIEKYIHSIYS